MCVNRFAVRIGVWMTVAAVLLTAVLSFGEAIGLSKAKKTLGYEDRLFRTSEIHYIDIVMPSWEKFLETCEDEQYVDCSVIIDNERLDHVGLRAKGNTSLMNVRMKGNNRYSLKLEFDHFQSGLTYHGLDKLCLNNLIQDNTYMKDYLTFQLMNAFQVKAPLCSYVLVTVNEEPWGLFLAIEGIEENFLQRTFGSAGGILYKPDSMGMGGGPGNGRNFRMNDMGNNAQSTDNGVFPPPPGMDGNGFQPPPPGMDGNGFPPAPPGMDGNGFPPPPPGMGGNGFPPPPGMGGNGFPPPPPGMGDNGFGPPDMGRADVKLQYIDDDPASYPGIFSSAKSPATRADKTRLIRSLKSLSEKKNLEEVLFLDDVLRYFVVHNYTVNGDSYTGGMVHNYYLYEYKGRLAMLPWDYNLAFGGFQGGNAVDSINDPLDTPLSVTGDGTRPMADWMFSEEYLEDYHNLFCEFLEIDVAKIIDEAYEVIAPYAGSVEKDPTHFCKQAEFHKAVETLKEFCAKRSESLRGQLDRNIPSTDDGQRRDSTHLVSSEITLSDMGTMGMPGGPGPGR